MKNLIILLLIACFGNKGLSEEEKKTIKEEVTGTVRIVGTVQHRKVSLSHKIENKISESVFCTNDKSEIIGKLGGLIIKVSGVWANLEGTASKCFMAENYLVEKMSSGRKPFIGILEKDGDQFIVKHKNGKTTPISRLSKRLRSFKGKKVIIDAKPNKKDNGQTWRVVTYMLYP